MGFKGGKQGGKKTHFVVMKVAGENWVEDVMGGRGMGRGISGQGKPDNCQYESVTRKLPLCKLIKK